MGRRSFKRSKLAAVAKGLRKDSAQQRFQIREKIPSSSSFSSLHNHLLQTQVYCQFCHISRSQSNRFDPNEVIDLIGEDIDIFFYEGEEEELDGIELSVEHVQNFWSVEAREAYQDSFNYFGRSSSSSVKRASAQCTKRIADSREFYEFIK